MSTGEEMRRVFVVGSPRSGTTLVQSILAGHADVWSLPETHFFPRVVPRRRRRMLGLASSDAASALEEVARLAGATELRAPGFPTIRGYARTFVRILDSASLQADCCAWVEKTPDHIHHIATIERLVPDPCFIHVVRSGHDVAASVVAVAAEHPQLWGGQRSIDQAAAIWASDVAITAGCANRSNHAVVRYEQLIEDGGSLGGVWGQLGLSEPPAGQRETEAILRAEEPWKRSVRHELFDGRSSRFALLSTVEREQLLAATADGQRLLDDRWPLR